MKIKLENEKSDFVMLETRLLKYKDKIYILRNLGLKTLNLDDHLKKHYSCHLGY